MEYFQKYSIVPRNSSTYGNKICELEISHNLPHGPKNQGNRQTNRAV